jgi:hypothetical protein
LAATYYYQEAPGGDLILLENGSFALLLEEETAVGVTGTLAVTDAADTLSASGTFTPAAVTGTLAVTDEADTLSASGTVTGPGTVTGTLAVTDATDTLSASGTFTPGAVTGTLAVTDGTDTISASGTVSNPTSADLYPFTVTVRETQAIAIREGRRMSGRVVYNQKAERPSLALWWLDKAGDLIDLSSGYTFSFKIGERGETALLTKTGNITGAAGAGTAPTGTPNVVVDWQAGELDLTPGTYLWQLTATNGSGDRTIEGTFVVLDAIN